MSVFCSFVLPAYKEKYLRSAIDSILAQTYRNFELIVVNDASPENIGDIVKSYDDARIRYYVNEENIGGKNLVFQWNHCLQYAKGDYVILASDDDLYSKIYLETMVKLAQQYPKVKIYRPCIQLIDENAKVLARLAGFDGVISLPEFIRSWMCGVVGSGIPYYMFNRHALLMTGGFVNFPLAWASDDATVFQLATNGIAFSRDILFSFRFSGINISSLMNTPDILKQKLQALESFNKWFWDFYNRSRDIFPREDSNVEYIRSMWGQFMQYKTYDLLNHSTIKASFNCLSFVYGLPWMSVWMQFKFYSKLVIKFIINRK